MADSDEDAIVDNINEAKTLLLILLRFYDTSQALARPRASLHKRTRRPFWTTTNALKDSEFRKAFRMDRVNFRGLVEKVRGAITKDERMGGLRNGAIEPEIRVAIVLRILSGASDLDLMVLWGVARPTIYQIFHETSAAIIEAYPMADFPQDQRRCAELSQGFSSSRNNGNPLAGCVGALDGIAVRIAKPRVSDCIDPASYYHRKGYYAIPVQAICDSSYRFIFFSAISSIWSIKLR